MSFMGDSNLLAELCLVLDLTASSLIGTERLNLSLASAIIRPRTPTADGVLEAFCLLRCYVVAQCIGIS
jgi:hypothetical protein